MASDSDQELSFVIIPDEDGVERFSPTTAQPTIMNVFTVHHGHNMHSQSGMSLEPKGTSGDGETSDGSFVMLYPEVGCPNHYSTKCNTENPNMYSSKIELDKEIEVKDSDVTEKGNMEKPEAKEAVEAAVRYSDSNSIPDEKRYSEENNNIPDEKRYSEESHGSTSVHSLDIPTDTHDIVSTAQNQASFGTLLETSSPHEETTKSTLSPSTNAHQSGHAHPVPAETTRMDTKMGNYGTYLVDFQPDSQGDHFNQWQHHYQPQPFIPGTVPPFESPTSSGGTRVPLAPGVLHTKPRNVIPDSACPIQPSRTVATSVAKKEHKFEDLEMDVTIWMECLGINGGSEEPVMKPLDPVAISSSDQWKISLLKEGCQVMLEDLENELQKHHARLDWSDRERSVQLVCCLTPETPGARELAKTWAENVINVLKNHLSTVKVEEVKVTREEYIEMAPLLQGETGEARVRMTCDEEEGRIFIVWDRDETVYIVRNLQSTINKVKENFNRRKRETCVHKEINKWKMLLLKKEKTDQKLKDKFSQLEVTYNFEACCMVLKGVDEEIHEMELLVEKDLRKIISRSHNWTSPLAKELWTFPEAKTVFESTCSGQDPECVIELTLNGFIVHSFNEEKVDEMLITGQRVLQEHEIPLAKETKEARRLPKWEELKTSLQERKRGLVLIRENQSSLTVVGINTTLNFEIQQLREFLNENGNYQYSSLVHDVCSQLLLTFMSENLDTRRQQEDFRIDDILFDDVTTSIVVKGNKAGIHAAQEAKNHFDRTLVCKRKTFTQPCMKEFLKCADWQSRRTKIEQKLKCRILGPAECPPELASIAVDATIQKGGLSQGVSALAHAPVQANSTATMLAEGHMDTNQKLKKEMQRKSEHASLAKLMKMRIFLQESSDITKQEHDVLVNSSNTSLNLELGQVSKALVKVGGNSIQKDCKKKYPRGIKMGDIAVSCAGNLKRVKMLFHCCLPEEKDPNKIRNFVAEVVRKCLQLADQSKLSSIGFPALGTGFLKYPPDLVAEAMYQATIDYSIEHPDCKVTDVFFVLLRQEDTAIIQAFTAIDALYKEFNTDSLLSAGPVLRQTNPNAQGIQTYPHFENSRSNEILFFVANSSRVIEEAERELLECYHDKIITLTSDVPHLDQWDDDHVTTIRNAGIPGYIDVTFDYARSRLALRGFEDTVRVLPVHTMITDADKHVQCKVQADLLAKQVQWSAVTVSETEEVLQPYSRINNYLIETAYSGGKTSVVVKCERTQQHVNVNFAAMEELPENPDFAKGVVPMRIIRHDLLQGMALDAPLPDRWTDMKGEIDVVPLSPKNPDYRRVAEAFNKNPKQHQQKIKMIFRVQNKTLHKQYMAMRKQIVDSLPPGKRCERDNMWHGTKEGSVDGIVRYGFNRSYSNCDANNYGQGVYFATEAEYSIRDAYATRNSRGDRHIFMCKVLVGEYTVGKPEMRFPPEIPGSNGRRYNSVVDDKEKPSTFVIFSDVQAYPEYLIEFK